MIILKDIHNCQIDESKVIQAYSSGAFMLEIMKDDRSVASYKYEDLELMENDIKRINKASTLHILCG